MGFNTRNPLRQEGFPLSPYFSPAAAGSFNRAAALRGQKLSEFMLESARRQAEEALLDQRVFFLEPQAYDAFLALLDAPAKPVPRLTELMRRKAPWDA